jgi:hypothetical protein
MFNLQVEDKSDKFIVMKELAKHVSFTPNLVDLQAFIQNNLMQATGNIAAFPITTINKLTKEQLGHASFSFFADASVKLNRITSNGKFLLYNSNEMEQLGDSSGGGMELFTGTPRDGIQIV